jgi:hypothetical protein
LFESGFEIFDDFLGENVRVGTIFLAFKRNRFHTEAM